VVSIEAIRMNLGHVAAGFLALTLVVPAGAAAPLIDQIDNGGFEDDLAEWQWGPQ